MLTALFVSPNKRKYSCNAPAVKLMPDLENYLTVKDAATELNLTQHGVRRLIRITKLEALSVGRMYLVSKKSVKDYLDKTRGLSKNDPTRGKAEK